MMMPFDCLRWAKMATGVAYSHLVLVCNVGWVVQHQHDASWLLTFDNKRPVEEYLFVQKHNVTMDARHRLGPASHKRQPG